MLLFSSQRQCARPTPTRGVLLLYRLGVLMTGIFLTSTPYTALATPTIHDVRDTVQAVPVDLRSGSATLPIKKGEVLHLLRLYHDTGTAGSWSEYMAYGACLHPDDGLCAVPFLDPQNTAYSLTDYQHAGEDALTTVGFYSVQSAQGHWNLFMIRVERPMGDSSYGKNPTTAHVSLFKLAHMTPGDAVPENNYFEEIATLPLGNYCNSNIALAKFLNQPLPAGTAPDGCMQ